MMKIRPATSLGETYGIVIDAENVEDEKVLKRFWVGGVKLNSYTSRSKGSSMSITFRDLIVPLSPPYKIKTKNDKV